MTTNVEQSQTEKYQAIAPDATVTKLTTSSAATLADFADVVWPSDNEWGIPMLDSAMQADALALPFDGWGTRSRQARGAGQQGTYHFYVDDYRFEAIWKKPWKLMESGCVAAVEPNYSLDVQSPLAYVIWVTYKKRWLNRYWQSKGIFTFVDLAVPTEFAWINFLGVPTDWKAYAARGYNRKSSQLAELYKLACDHHGGKVLFVVYGGGKAVQELARTKGWCWVPEQADASRGRNVEMFPGTVPVSQLLKAAVQEVVSTDEPE